MIEDWKYLIPFGYAPGNYMSTCRRCLQNVVDLDKRASSCFRCAKEAYETYLKDKND